VAANVKTAPAAAVAIVAVIKPLNRIPIEPISSSLRSLCLRTANAAIWRHPRGRPTSWNCALVLKITAEEPGNFY
jgi:hypothetical protein